MKTRKEIGGEIHTVEGDGDNKGIVVAMDAYTAQSTGKKQKQKNPNQTKKKNHLYFSDSERIIAG